MVTDTLPLGVLQVRLYETADEECPFADWFDRLPAAAADRVDTALERMRRGNFGDHKSVGDGVMERRIDHGPGYRIYFGRDGQELVVVLVGGTKKRQSRDIETAKKHWKDYKKRKRS